MKRITKLSPDTSCANLECPNAVGEGMFELVRVSDDLIVGGHRSVSLLLCMPCSSAVQVRERIR